jgi:DNA-binding transcriptional LysR family regulator
LDIEYFSEFIELAHCCSFSNAARYLNTTQSVLSKHISAMEREFGTTLFTRSKPRIELTSSGKVLLEEAFAIVNSYQTAKERLSKRTGSKVLSIGGNLYNEHIAKLITQTIRAAKKQNLNIVVNYKKLPSQSYVSQILEGKIDLLFCAFDREDAETLGLRLFLRFLFDDKLVLVMRQTHRLASKELVTIDDIADEVVVSPFGNYSLIGHRIVERAMKRREIWPRLRPVYAESVSDFPYIDLGDDILFIERVLFKPHQFPEDYIAIPFASTDIVFPMYVAYRNNLEDEDLKQFIDLLAENAKLMTVPVIRDTLNTPHTP